MDEDILVAAGQILEGAKRKGLTVRLLGGTAVRMCCPSATHRSLARSYPDIDLITYKKDSKALGDLLAEMGVEPVPMFNALHGDKRMLFMDEKHNRQVDVFIDFFEMCHRFDFRKRMLLDDKTLPMADLLLTKLQIVEINEKDYKDIICMIIDHPISETDDKDSVNAAYIASLCAGDWGIWRTITRNLDWVRAFVKDFKEMDPETRDSTVSRINALLARIDGEPKGLGWRMRAKIGDKVVWYDTPERVGRITTGQ